MSEAAPKKVVAKTVAKTVKKTVTKAGAKSGAKSADKKDGAPEPELKFALSKFSPVYIVMWKGENTVCSICRYDFTEPCPNCQLSKEVDSCPIQTGTCGHKFHLHCIQGWINKDHDHCPLCNLKWEVAND